MNYPIRDTASNIDKPVWSIWLNSPHLSFSGTFKTTHHSALTTVHDIRSMNLQDTQTKNFESNCYAHYPLDSKTTRNWHLVYALKMPKECDILHKKKIQKRKKHLVISAEVPRWDSFLFPYVPAPENSQPSLPLLLLEYHRGYNTDG